MQQKNLLAPASVDFAVRSRYVRQKISEPRNGLIEVPCTVAQEMPLVRKNCLGHFLSYWTHEKCCMPPPCFHSLCIDSHIPKVATDTRR